MSEVITCDDCDKIAGIYICTGCYEKAKAAVRVEEMKKAIRILESRQRTAKALTYEEDYLAAYEDALIFLRAELERLERPNEAIKFRTVFD
jgi:hypothetical protein